MGSQKHGVVSGPRERGGGAGGSGAAVQDPGSQGVPPWLFDRGEKWERRRKVGKEKIKIRKEIKIVNYKGKSENIKYKEKWKNMKEGKIGDEGRGAGEARGCCKIQGRSGCCHGF